MGGPRRAGVARWPAVGGGPRREWARAIRSVGSGPRCAGGGGISAAWITGACTTALAVERSASQLLTVLTQAQDAPHTPAVLLAGSADSAPQFRSWEEVGRTQQQDQPVLQTRPSQDQEANACGAAVAHSSRNRARVQIGRKCLTVFIITA